MKSKPQPARLWRPRGSTFAFIVCVTWLVITLVAVSRLRFWEGLAIGALAGSNCVLTVVLMRWNEKLRWHAPIDRLAGSLSAVKSGKVLRIADEIPDDLEVLQTAMLEILIDARRKARQEREPVLASPQPLSVPRDDPADVMLERSGLFDGAHGATSNPYLSAEYATTDMINRLDPETYHWMDSSQAEQTFLGWCLAELRQKSFLDILHQPDRPRAQAHFEKAIVQGEAFGLIVRVIGSEGRKRAIEINAAARYNADQQLTHIRCHITDVTAKVRTETERRRRNRELTKVNIRLLLTNRELEELKDRYSDLYEHAPAMYFSLDERGSVVECNQTMLATLAKSRSDVINAPFSTFLEPGSRDRVTPLLEQLLLQGAISFETQWVKSNGEVIDVGLLGSRVHDARSQTGQARFVAQDVTTRKRLEAELHEKNNRLALANAELSQKNRELDEFVHVVSHDLQEPLRTLIAFSDFLERDYGDRIDGDGKEYIRYITDASRRMRAMIIGLLNLSRLGEVTGEFSNVDLNDVVAVVITDLQELIRSKAAQVCVAHPLPSVWGDHARLGQLFANLISNGLKYNRAEIPRVEIGASENSQISVPGEPGDHDAGSPTVLYVKDNGIGIEPQFHRTIFQLFRRLHTREEFEGTGVGLSLCGKIVKAHGGTLWVESELGHGSTFFIRLPAAPLNSSQTVADPMDESAVDLATLQV